MEAAVTLTQLEILVALSEPAASPPRPRASASPSPPSATRSGRSSVRSGSLSSIVG